MAFRTNNLNDITYDELFSQPYFIPDPGAIFNSIIIVPLPKMHDSGYSCMKFILMHQGNVVGVVGGNADVMMLLSSNKYSWNLDCLNESKCIRLFTQANIHVTIYDCSSFIISAS